MIRAIHKPQQLDEKRKLRPLEQKVSRNSTKLRGTWPLLRFLALDCSPCVSTICSQHRHNEHKLHRQIASASPTPLWMEICHSKRRWTGKRRVASGATGQQRMRLWSEEYRRQDFGAEIPRALQSSAQNKQRKSRKRFHGGLLIPAQCLIIGNRGWSLGLVSD